MGISVLLFARGPGDKDQASWRISRQSSAGVAQILGHYAARLKMLRGRHVSLYSYLLLQKQVLSYEH